MTSQCGRDGDGRETGSRDLVPLLPAERPAAGPDAGRPAADFVTQLLACRAGLSGYRLNRRADPATALSIYGEAAGRSRRTRARLDASV